MSVPRDAIKYVCPDLTNAPSALLCVPIPLIPFFRQFFGDMQHKSIWQSREDWFNAYQAFSELEDELMSGCMQQMITEQQRMYRLLDAALNGTVYEVDTPATGTTPAIITPAIPDVPGSPAGIVAGLRQQLLDAQGILPSGWPFGFGSKPATTADVVRAMRADTAAQVTRAKTAISALQEAAQVATIFGTVASFLEDGAAATEEGGILIVTLIGLMSNAAMMGLQAKQIDELLAKMDRLIKSLDGGATPAPAENVISRLVDIDVMLGGTP
jgi:hypothetical protein